MRCRLKLNARRDKRMTGDTSLRTRVNFCSLSAVMAALVAGTPGHRETHHAETPCSAHVLTFASCHRVDGRDKRDQGAA
jgi:hypothetical protein